MTAVRRRTTCLNDNACMSGSLVCKSIRFVYETIYSTPASVNKGNNNIIIANTSANTTNEESY